MTLKTLIAAAFVGLTTGTAVDAARFTYDGIEYDLRYFNGSFTGHRALFESQVWYGDRSFARSLALASDWYIPSTSPSGNRYGPVFVIGLAQNEEFIDVIQLADVPAAGTPFAGIYSIEATIRWPYYVVAAQATPIPLPAAGLFLLTALAGIAAVKRRDNRAA